MDAWLCEYTKNNKTELYLLKAYILWYVNYSSVKLLYLKKLTKLPVRWFPLTLIMIYTIY